MGCLFLQRGISISKSIERILSRMEVLTVQEVGYLEKSASFIDHQEFSLSCGVALVIVDSALDKFYLPMLTIIMNKESIEFLQIY